MKRILTSIAFLALPLITVAQDARPADPDAAVKKTLASMNICADFDGAGLEYIVRYLEESVSEPLNFYIDPVEIPEPGEIKIAVREKNVNFDQFLRSSLKPLKLEHFVWQGIVVISTAKGAAAFKSPAWMGFDRKSVESNKELSKKLDQVCSFDWSPFDAVKAVEALSKGTGVAIDGSGLKRVDALPEPEHRIYPRHATLYGALVFLSRTTGVTFEVGKGGSLVAKPPPKKGVEK